MFEIIVKGGPVMVPLGVASVVSVAIMVERALFWLKRAGRVDAEKVIGFAREGRLDSALKECEKRDSPLLNVLKAGLSGTEPTLSMEAEAAKELKEMEKGLSTLDTIITLSPLLGLFGTIVGMIQSFGIMSEAGLNKPHAITGGIAEALIATAAGIAVAVMSLVPYNYFRSRVERTLYDMERYATRLEVAMKEKMR